jgi:hypothetical protein
MELNLTSQQSAAVHANPGKPVTLVDQASSETFYLVSEPTFLHLQGLAEETEAWRQDRLKQLVREGIDSDEVPAAEAFAELRSLAEAMTRQSPCSVSFSQSKRLRI